MGIFTFAAACGSPAPGAPPQAPSGPDAATPTDAGASRPLDAGMDAATGAALLAWCPTLDADWQLVSVDPAACATVTLPSCDPGRVSAWVADITLGFATALQNDCRISAMGTELQNDQVTDYLNQLNAWALAFFGCPDGTSDAAIRLGTFGLIPTPMQSHVFTSADLRLLGELYLQASEDAVAASPSQATLSAAQISQETAALAAWIAAEVPSPIAADVYTLDSCAATADAGADGGGAVADASADTSADVATADAASAEDGGTGATDAGDGGADACAPVSHVNGLGGSWRDCQPLGTYTLAEAQSACSASLTGSACSAQMACGLSYVTKTTGRYGTQELWVYASSSTQYHPGDVITVPSGGLWCAWLPRASAVWR